MRLGLHVCCYESAEFLDRFFDSWVQLRNSGKVELLVSVGHCCFKENFENGFNVNSNDGTHEKLLELADKKVINYYKYFDNIMTEAEARTKILEPLLNQIDYLFISAPDEIFEFAQLEYIINYVQKEDLIDWFRIGYKNYVSETEYVLGFNPPRVFKTLIVQNGNEFKLVGFYYDDDPKYEHRNGSLVSYKEFPNKLIPKILVKHLTWNDLERSRKKINYQLKHFGRCSWEVDDINKKVRPSLNYFKKTGEQIPIIFADE